MAETTARRRGKRTDNTAAAAPRKRWVITPLQALEIRARREAHDDDMEELVVGLTVVQIESAIDERLVPELVSSDEGGRDRKKDPHWLELSGSRAF